MNDTKRMKTIPLIILLPCMMSAVWMVPVFCIAQNITPRPTSFAPSDVEAPPSTPTPIRRLQLDIQRIIDVRLAAVSNRRMVFIENTSTDDNKRLYVWEPGKAKLIDTGKDGLAGSVFMPEDGRYMIFLHDENKSGRNIDGDTQSNVVMRMYHFDSGQTVNLGLPARSATPLPDQSRSQFEIRLKNNLLVFSVSDSGNNDFAEKDAPWNIVNMLDVVYAIEGTPTPTPSFTPVIVGSPTPTPVPPTPTPIPTVPPAFRSNADINADGKVDTLDILLFQFFWGT